MYNIIKDEIKNGRKLTDVNRLINIALTAGAINDVQYRELRKMAHDAANHNDNQPELREMVLALAARVAALEAYHAEQPEEPDIPEDTGYPAWEPWDGISNKYQHGAIVTHNDKVWESIFAGQNTWEPGVIGTEKLWREFTA